MIPADIVVQKELPRLTSGKVDRSALPSPKSVECSAQLDGALPATELERLVQESVVRRAGPRRPRRQRVVLHVRR
jgi:hypothetical protein